MAPLQVTLRLWVASLATGELLLDELVPAVAPAPANGVAPRVVAAFLDSYKRKDDSMGYRYSSLQSPSSERTAVWLP